MTAAEDAKLRVYAHPAGDARWWFSSPEYTHGRASALNIIDACLMLGVRVTDVATSEAHLALINRVVLLEARIASVEQITEPGP